MTAAFIVHVEIPDLSPTTLGDEAEYIFELLNNNGVPVESVAPWARPTVETLVPPISPLSPD